MEQITCKICNRIYQYNKRKGHTRTKCNSCMVNYRRDAVKKWAIEYKGGKCKVCGYNKCMRALCFHHLDPEKKDFQINARSAAHSQDIRQRELDKCVLLCSNCHMELHDEIERKLKLQKQSNC